MKSNPREAAIAALYKIEKDGAYSNRAVIDALFQCEPMDKALANEIIMGVIRNKLYLDFIIQKYSKIKLKKLSTWVLLILRTAVYQLVMMDKIPSSAACNEAVKLAGRYAHSAAKGYVNGVLRSISSSVDDLPKPTGSKTEQMSVLYSCPLWLAEKLAEQFGEQKCEEILKDSLLPHMTTVRANILKITAEELCKALKDEGNNAELIEGECVKINGAIDVTKSNAYKDGFYTLQNINSYRAAKILSPKSDEVVIDMCSAPGGKTTHIAELMGNRGRVIAFDIHPHKIGLIEKAAKRLGITCVEAKCNNSENVIEELKGVADKVLADVPCSGIGVIHKKPDVKYNRKAEDIEELTRIQENILETSARYVKAGGDIVYSTCTILAEENENQIKRFLLRHSDFEVAFEKLYLADETGGSGFYICKLHKKQ